MADYLIQDTTLDAIADAINAKTGGSSAMTPAEMVTEIGNIPSGTTITDGIVVTARDANNYPLAVDVYGTLAYAQFSYGSEGHSYATAWRYLSSATLKSGQTDLPAYSFKGVPLTALTGIDAITTAGSWALGRTNFTSLILPNLNSIAVSNLFSYCTSLVTLKCPKASGYLTNGANRLCWGDTALQTVEFGGVGYGLTASNSQNAFTGCTQSGLTITVYATGTNADALVTAIRNGATNATIIIKASEATTYNGTSYAAGETILTSEVTS